MFGPKQYRGNALSLSLSLSLYLSPSISISISLSLSLSLVGVLVTGNLKAGRFVVSSYYKIRNFRSNPLKFNQQERFVSEPSTI